MAQNSRITRETMDFINFIVLTSSQTAQTDENASHQFGCCGTHTGKPETLWRMVSLLDPDNNQPLKDESPFAQSKYMLFIVAGGIIVSNHISWNITKRCLRWHEPQKNVVRDVAGHPRTNLEAAKQSRSSVDSNSKSWQMEKRLETNGLCLKWFEYGTLNKH